MTEEELDAYAQLVAEAAPPLTAEQKIRIAALLRPVRVEEVVA